MRGRLKVDRGALDAEIGVRIPAPQLNEVKQGKG